MNLYFDTFKTHVGEFSIAVDDLGAVAATAFGDAVALRRRAPMAARLVHNQRFTQPAREQVRAYFAGERQNFTVPLRSVGTEFQRQVWAGLQRIPFGDTRSYGSLAAELGNPKASRAVGRANATNPICLLVPCHRVIGADGSLTGFAFGEEIKRRLLEHEAATVAAPRNRQRGCASDQKTNGRKD